MPVFKTVALGGASALVYAFLPFLHAANGRRPVLVFLTCLLVLFSLYAALALVLARHPAANLWKPVAAGAILFRLLMLPAGLPLQMNSLPRPPLAYQRFLLFDNDIWRYLWDGHVAAAGINPYVAAPDAPALDPLAQGVWADIRDDVGYQWVPTIYPPLAQMLFQLCHAVAPGSVLAMKAMLTGFDLTAATFLGLTLRMLGRNPAWCFLYAWNPLVLKAFAGSGHVDAVAVACLAAVNYFLVKKAPRRSAVLFGLAVLAKLSPVVLLPFLARRIGRRATMWACAAIAAGYLPYAAAGRSLFAGFAGFARDWQFNSSMYRVVYWIESKWWANPSELARATCGVLLVLALVWLWRCDNGRTTSFAAVGANGLGLLLLFSPAVMPWYTTWLVPFAVAGRQWIWLAFTFTVRAAFLVMIDGTERPAILAGEYGSFACLWLGQNIWPQFNELTNKENQPCPSTS